MYELITIFIISAFKFHSEWRLNVLKKRKVSKGLYWTPRLLSILFICFIAMFSLDVFSPGMSFGEIMLALLMHNIPTLVLVVILIISWNYEIVGGICFILAGMLYIVFALSQQISPGTPQ